MSRRSGHRRRCRSTCRGPFEGVEINAPIDHLLLDQAPQNPKRSAVVFNPVDVSDGAKAGSRGLFPIPWIPEPVWSLQRRASPTQSANEVTGPLACTSGV